MVEPDVARGVGLLRRAAPTKLLLKELASLQSAMCQCAPKTKILATALSHFRSLRDLAKRAIARHLI